MKETFVRILENHAGRYPLMGPQDYGKLIYQSEFGPGHLISDKRKVRSYMLKEWKSLPRNSSPGSPEAIGDSIYRFPLSECSSEDDIRLLTDLFILTAGEHSGDRDGLEEKLAMLDCMNIPGMSEWEEEWRGNGCPPVHHSNAYREAYNPHYRLLKKEYVEYFPVLSEIYRIMHKQELPGIAACESYVKDAKGNTYLMELIRKLMNIAEMEEK